MGPGHLVTGFPAECACMCARACACAPHRKRPPAEAWSRCAAKVRAALREPRSSRAPVGTQQGDGDTRVRLQELGVTGDPRLCPSQCAPWWAYPQHTSPTPCRSFQPCSCSCSWRALTGQRPAPKLCSPTDDRPSLTTHAHQVWCKILDVQHLI